MPLLPLINYERMYGIAVYKETLLRRGIIATNLSRAPGAVLDEDDRRELDVILKDVEELFTL